VCVCVCACVRACVRACVSLFSPIMLDIFENTHLMEDVPGVVRSSIVMDIKI